MNKSKVIAVANIKGGVGKTTTAVNLSHALSMAGYSILLIDLDPQCSGTSFLGAIDNKKNISRVYKREIPFLASIKVLESIDIAFVSSHPDLRDVEQSTTPMAFNFLDYHLKKLAGETSFDFCLIDCQGSIGTLTQAALIASDYVVMPLQTEILNINALLPFLSLFNEIQEVNNPGLKLLGIVPCMFHRNRNIDKVTIESALDTFGSKIFNTRIHRNVKLSESPAGHQTIFQYAPKSQGARDYKALAKEFLERIKDNEKEETRP